MIDIDIVKSYYPPVLTQKKEFNRHILKEYVELMALDFLSRTEYARHIVFIGGTNLRLIKGTPRFSEDLDFDCRGLDKAMYMDMTEMLVKWFTSNGLSVEARFRENPKFDTWQRKIVFPELMFKTGMSAMRTEKLILKIDAQDQGVDYPVKMAMVSKCGFHFSIPVPPDSVLLSMKLLSILQRGKGRDYYDALFLQPLTSPDYSFLEKKAGIVNEAELKAKLTERLKEVNLREMASEFRHLAFPNANTERVLDFATLMGLD